MGSWYGTCGISQLPILYNDEIVLFLLRKNDENKVKSGGFVHSDDLYYPVSPPISGIYEDYGRIKNAEVDIRTLRNLFDYETILNESSNYNTSEDIINNYCEQENFGCLK